MQKNNNFRVKNVMFDRFQLLSKVYFPGCTTLNMSRVNTFIPPRGECINGSS